MSHPPPGEVEKRADRYGCPPLPPPGTGPEVDVPNPHSPSCKTTHVPFVHPICALEPSAQLP